MIKSSNTNNSELKAWKQSFIIDNRQIISINKDLPKLFSFCNTIHPWNQIINKTLKQNDQKDLAIQNEQKKINTKLRDISSSVKDLKTTLQNYEHTNQFLVKVQHSSQDIFTKIQKLKEKMSTEFQEMLDVEDALQADLKLYDDKIQSIIQGVYHCEGGVKSTKTKMQQNVKDLGNKQNQRLCSGKKPFRKDTNKQIKVEQQQSKANTREQNMKLRINQLLEQLKTTQGDVENLQNKINSLGKNLGWVQQDHSDFIKIWNRGSSCSKNYFEIQDELSQYFKLYTGEQIRDHMNKHMKHKKLLEQKKEKILQYKSLKQQKKVIEFQIIAEQQEAERIKVSKQAKNVKSEEDQILLKERVEEWKKQKAQKKLKQEQNKRIQQQRKQEQKMRRIIQNQRKKEALQKWKQEQEEIKSKQMIESRATKRTSTGIDKQTEQRIRARQEKLIAQKMELQLRKKYQEQEQFKKQRKLKQQKMVKYSYVNSKLQEKTTAIKEKQRSKFDGKQKKDANTFGGNLLHAGVRATPSWMQGI